MIANRGAGLDHPLLGIKKGEQQRDLNTFLMASTWPINGQQHQQPPMQQHSYHPQQYHHTSTGMGGLYTIHTSAIPQPRA